MNFHDISIKPRPRGAPRPVPENIATARKLLKRARLFENLADKLRQRASRKLGRKADSCPRSR